MKRIAKIVSIVLVVMISVSVLAGCGTKTISKTESSTTALEKKEQTTKAEEQKKVIALKMWGGVPAENGPQAACDNFNKEFAAKGIKIEYERFVNDEQGNLKLDTNLMAGSDIDLYMTYTIEKLKKRITGNMALDLTQLSQKDGYNIDEQFGELGKTWKVDGKYYGVPTNKSVYCIIANKKMFDEAKIAIPTSWTLDEFREIAKKLTKGEGQNKVYGMFFNTQQETGYPFEWARTVMGSNNIIKAETKESLHNDSVNEKYVQTFVDMMTKDKSAPTHVDSVTQKLTIEGMFLSGKAAMSVGPWITRSIRDKAKFPHDFVTAYLPYPVLDKSAKAYTPASAGDFLIINPKSKYVNEAWEFVKWYGEKGMAPLIPGGRVPANVKFSSDDIVKTAMQGVEDLFDATTYKNNFAAPSNPFAVITVDYPEINKMKIEEMEAIYTGKKTVKDGLAALKKRADEFLKQQK